MRKKCPNCASAVGLREALYGFPIFPVDEEKYFIAECTASGGKYVCVSCRWGIEGEDE